MLLVFPCVSMISLPVLGYQIRIDIIQCIPLFISSGSTLRSLAMCGWTKFLDEDCSRLGSHYLLFQISISMRKRQRHRLRCEGMIKAENSAPETQECNELVTAIPKD